MILSVVFNIVVSSFCGWCASPSKRITIISDIPWLFLYASPGATSPEAAADYWAVRAQNIETVYIGHGLHYVQEDQPYAIGRAISDWYRRLEEK